MVAPAMLRPEFLSSLTDDDFFTDCISVDFFRLPA